MIYLDSSALVKLLFEERESEALVQWLDERKELPKASSELSTIELVRICRRQDGSSVDQARQLLSGLDLLPMTGEIVDRAAVVEPVGLRSLDAIHLASALVIKEDLSFFVVYDTRLKDAATGAGLTVVSPT